MKSLYSRRAVVVAALAAIMLLGVVPIASADHGADPAAVATAANPPFPEVCGIDVGIALDTSNSIINDSPANPGIMKDAAKAFVDALTGTPSRVSVYSFQTNASLELGLTEVGTAAGADAVKAAIDSVVFGDGSPTGGTNWQAGFEVTQGQGLDALAFATDGNPTTHNGDGDAGSPPGEPEDLEAGITAANSSKAEGTRIIGVGIGSSLTVANLQRIAGPTVGDDYYLPASFAAFQATLEEIANRLCAPSVTVQNLVDDGTGTFAPQPGWVYTGTSTVGITANPADGTTLADGQVNFKLDSAADIDLVQATLPGFTLQSVTCQLTTGGAVTTVDILDGVTVTLGNEDIAVCEFRNIPEAAGLSVDKVADTAIAQVGDTITYTYTVTNTGNVTIDNLTLSDDKLGAVTLVDTTLPAGASTTGTAAHLVTAADLAGPLTNVATATGTDPNGNALTDTDDASVDLSGMSLVKTVGSATATVGDALTYTYVITNVGNVELTNVTLTDDKIGSITLPGSSLQPGESMTATATYVVTAADAASPPLVNIGTAGATDPAGNPVGATDDAEVTTIVLQAAVTTTTTTTVAILPVTGGQVDTRPASVLGMTFLMLGGLLLLGAMSRRRQLAAQGVKASHDAREWARRQLFG